MTEPRADRLKRLRMRSMRRGTKEMDIILTRYAEARLAALAPAALETYDALLAENDQDLYRWVTGQAATPGRFAEIVADIARTATGAG